MFSNIIKMSMSVPLVNMTAHTAVTTNSHHKSTLALVQRVTNFVMTIDLVRISTSVQSKFH